MTFWQYIFRFLYVRNWHTGHRELSYSRLYWFCAGLGLLTVMLIILYNLQAPISHSVL